MADTSKEGLLLGGGIRHITTASQITRGSKQVPPMSPGQGAAVFVELLCASL